MTKSDNKGLKNPINIVVFLLMLVYLANLTFGVDLIPDNIPLIGNIDEIIATYIALRSVGVTK